LFSTERHARAKTRASAFVSLITVMRGPLVPGLDPGINRRISSPSFIVIPAKAGIQLPALSAASWTPTFVGVTSVAASSW